MLGAARVRCHLAGRLPGDASRSVESPMQSPIGGTKDDKSHRQPGGNPDQHPLDGRHEVYLALRICRDEDNCRHDQSVPDEIDAPEWIDCRVESRQWPIAAAPRASRSARNPL